MRPQRTPAKSKPKTVKQFVPTEPVKVFCRLRYVDQDPEENCVDVLSDQTIRLATSDGKSTEYQFSQVFNRHVMQPQLFNDVCIPMVEGIMKGKSGLLFTYGVTSSGKTYTMTGTADNPGILPRSLDMIFNSLEPVLAEKYTFSPDGMNGFNIQSEADIMLTKQEKEILPQSTTPMKNTRNRNKVDVQYDIDFCRSENVNMDCRYSVFVSYVEIYNDYVYDLLEEVQYDPFQRPKPPQSKRLREDKAHNMFVYGGNEVEVRSTKDAFAVFKTGQERRRIAHTQLNAESSRSHSIFNIRVVQAPLDSMGEDLLQEKSLICVSQLALVDLAGSERTSRTRAGGERLREAGNINSSLMTLRRCLEQLRENQKSNAGELVKYRNSKLTYLFKNFFEGRGQVKMIICINPRKQECDENFYVMQFAEMAQQVEVAQPEEFKVDKESIKRKAEQEKTRKEEERRREMSAAKKLRGDLAANSLYNKQGRRNCRRNLSATSLSSDTTTDVDAAVEKWVRPSYWNISPLPSFEVHGFNDENTLPNFIEALRKQIRQRERLEKDRNEMFAHCLLSCRGVTEKESDHQIKLNELREELAQKNRDASRMEKQIKKLENKNLVLQRTTDIYEKDKNNLQCELTRKDLELKESITDNRKLESRMRGAVANTRAQYEKEMGNKVRNAKAEMQEQVLLKEEKLRQLKSIMAEGRTSRRFTPIQSTSSAETMSSGKRLTHKRRSRSAENLLAETKPKTPSSLNKSRKISTSDYNLRQLKPKRPPPSNPTVDTDEEEVFHSFSRKTQTPIKLAPHRPMEHGEGSPCKSNRLRSCGCCYGNDTKYQSDSELDSLILEQENPVLLGCKYVNTRNEDKMRFRPALPIAPKHTRTRSGTGNNNWLAHKPVETLQTDTILQPHIKPNKVTHNPSPKDIKNARKYLLTHQKEDRNGEIETQLIKGDVIKTRTGGQQVHFNDIEILKTKDPNRREVSPRKHKPDETVAELSASEEATWTDVETRCSTAVEHKVGGAGPTIRNYPKRKK